MTFEEALSEIADERRLEMEKFGDQYGDLWHPWEAINFLLGRFIALKEELKESNPPSKQTVRQIGLFAVRYLMTCELKK